jgi:hypothetical protein
MTWKASCEADKVLMIRILAQLVFFMTRVSRHSEISARECNSVTEIVHRGRDMTCGCF